MHKKLITACVVVAALAALPSLASANPVLTHPTGTVAPVGTKITATNLTNPTLTTSLGNLICSTAVLTGELTANSTAGGIDGTVTSALFGGTGGSSATEPEPECTGTGFIERTFVTATDKYCVEATKPEDTLSVRGGACNEKARNVVFRLVMTVFGGPATITCAYSKASMNGTFLTHPEDAVGTFVEQEFTKLEGGGECPTIGKVDMKLTLETDSVTTLPVYISS